jgi:predicted metalloprotease with PDZ domain
MRFLTALLTLALAVLAPGAATAATSAVTYEIRPILKDGRLDALAFEARLRGDADGSTTLRFPQGGDPVDYSFSGAGPILMRDDGVVITHAPGAALAVRYQIRSGYDRLPTQQPMKPLLQPDWFAVHGEQALVRVEDREDARVAVVWRDVPQRWTTVAHLGPERRMRTLWDDYLLGGLGWREANRPLGKARLTLWWRPEGWEHPPEAAFDKLAATLQAGFDYWRDPPGDVFAPILQLGGGDFGGRGLAGGFLLVAGPDVDLLQHTRVFAHEQQHAWISRQIGGFPAVEPNLEAWLNEGFADAFTARALLRARLWTAEDFAADLNAALIRYWTSPVREAPNRRIQADRGHDFDVGKLPYDRGRLLALLWERQFRDASRFTGVLDVLQIQRRMARANLQAGRSASADLLFPEAVRAGAGLDLSAGIARYVDRGDAVVLPADLFAACGRITWITQPAFDRGFDLPATLQNQRRVTGLSPDGPAARAGLREGDRIRISEIPSHDSQTPLTYRVVDAAGAERRITYKPEGPGEVRIQRLVLVDMGPAERERCVRQLIGEGVE